MSNTTENPMFSETLLRLTDATRAVPYKRCSRGTLERWIRKGLKGICLEFVWLGGVRYTSEEAIGRFFANVEEARKVVPPCPSTPLTKLSSRECDKRIKELGL